MKKVLPSAVACSWNCSTMPSGDCARKPVEYGRDATVVTRERPDNLPQITLRVKVQCHSGGKLPSRLSPLFFLHKRERQRERNMH